MATVSGSGCFIITDDARLENDYEERRIFYVGATRAKKQLIVLNNDT